MKKAAATPKNSDKNVTSPVQRKKTKKMDKDQSKDNFMPDLGAMLKEVENKQKNNKDKLTLPSPTKSKKGKVKQKAKKIFSA